MFEVKLATPDGKSYQTQVDRLSLPTPDGQRTILTNHIETVIPVDIGKIRLTGSEEDDKAVQELVVSNGIFHFKDNQGQVFVRSYEFPDEIDRDRTEEAKKRAEEILNSPDDHSDDQVREARLALKRAKARLSLSA